MKETQVFSCSSSYAIYTVDAYEELIEEYIDELESQDCDTVGHTLIYHAAADASCLTTGNIEYWECYVCGKLFFDEDGNITYTLTVDQNGFTYSETKTVEADTTTDDETEDGTTAADETTTESGTTTAADTTKSDDSSSSEDTTESAETADASSESSDSDSVETGDTNRVMLWISMLGIGIIGVTGACGIRRRQRGAR